MSNDSLQKPVVASLSSLLLVAIHLLLLTSCSTTVLAATKPSQGCGNATPKTPNNTAITVQVNNKAREYLVRLPTSYNATYPYRLVFTLHALQGSAAEVVEGRGGYLPYYGLPPLANESTIFVAPNGLNRGWANQGGEDILLVDAILASVESDLCVDQSRRFSTGFSYGGAMSHSIACSRGKEFRGVAVLSSGSLSGCVGGDDPVAYYAQHGKGDDVLTIAQGRALRDRFVRNNGCTALADDVESGLVARANGTHAQTRFQGCREGFPVEWVVFDGGHTPFPRDAGVEEPWTPGEVWRFFEQFD